MAKERSYDYFWNSKSDRYYDADSMADWLRPFFTNGVFNGQMQVTANNNMSVTVADGYGYINGKLRHFLTPTTLDLETASGTLSRIDAVMLRRNDAERRIHLVIVKGGNAQTPAAPAPVREGAIYDLKLAEIYIAAGTVSIIQADISDTRMDDDVCGWVAATVDQIKFKQIQAQFDSWFRDVKEKLSEDVAGRLLMLIESLEKNKLDKTGDASNTTVIFTSDDEEDPTKWTDMPLLESGEKHSILWKIMSDAIKNIRYTKKFLGTTDISKIGDGTVTGGISSLNSKLGKASVIFGQCNSGTISGKLVDYGISSDMTLAEMLQAIPGNSYPAIIVVSFNSHNNTLNNSMPVTSGGILIAHQNYGSNTRCSLQFINYRNGDTYTASYTDSTVGPWKRRANIDEIPTKAADIGALPLSGGIMNGNGPIYWELNGGRVFFARQSTAQKFNLVYQKTGDSSWTSVLLNVEVINNGNTATINLNGTANNITGIAEIANGGTGANNAASARTNLGLGNAATRSVQNNLNFTESGGVLDARQGKSLNDKITNINERLLYGIYDHPNKINSSYNWSNFDVSLLPDKTILCTRIDEADRNNAYNSGRC